MLVRTSAKFYMEWNLLKVSGKYLSVGFQFISVSQSYLTVCNPMDCSTPGFCLQDKLPGLLKLMSIEVAMSSDHITLCHPFLFPNSIFPNIRVFSKESVFCIKCPEYWSFSFSTSPSNQYSGLISLRIDWFDPLANQGTLKRLLQHISSKASMLQHSTFFTVHSHIHTWLLEKP